MGAPRGSAALILARRRPSIQDETPGKRSLPGQEGKAPARGACRDDRAHTKPFKNKVYKIRDRDPGKRSLPGKAVPGPGPHLRRHAPAGPGDRQASEPGEPPAPTRSRPRQGICRGEWRCVPALQLTRPRVALGAIPGTRGGWLCSLGGTVALLGGEAIAVANGDAVTDAFGVDGDGH